MKRPLRFGLLGQNISYSLSPDIFNRLFSILGHSGEFRVIDCAPEELESQLENARSWDGFSVTVPYKKILLSRMHQLSEEAAEIGAVNSVRIDGGRFAGYNTDAEGFWGPLEKASLSADRILIMGNGGAAAAVLWVLAHKFPGARIDICGRDEKKVKNFILNFGLPPERKRSIQETTFAVLHANAEYDMIVNCTPAGGPSDPENSPLLDDFEFRGCPLCYDLNYRPARTVLMRRAATAGCRLIGGYNMLVRQAVASYAIWTGCDLDREAVSNEIVRLSGGADEGGVL